MRRTVLQSGFLKNLGLLGVGVLCINIIGVARAASFSDVPIDSPYAPFIDRLAQASIVTGHRDEDGRNLGVFRPDDNATLAEVLKMSVRASGRPLPYPHVPSNLSAQGTWAAPYVNAGAERRFAVLRDNRVNVFRQITRAEVMQTLADAFGLTLASATRQGLFGSNTDVRMNDPVSRGNVAIMLTRFLGFAPSSGTPVVVTPTPVTSTPTPTPVVSEPTSSVAPTPTPIAPSPDGPIGTITGPVNVRYRADVTANAMVSLPAGTQVIVLDQSNPAWFFIRLPDGREGFVVRKFVRIGG